jgi:hypothetical protein
MGHQCDGCIARFLDIKPSAPAAALIFEAPAVKRSWPWLAYVVLSLVLLGAKDLLFSADLLLDGCHLILFIPKTAAAKAVSDPEIVIA